MLLCVKPNAMFLSLGCLWGCVVLNENKIYLKENKNKCFKIKEIIVKDKIN